ncbi:MAG: hypothetical protein V7640_2594 [Betaproteobacteria bacterium]
MLRQGAHVINVARGGVADEPALIERADIEAYLGFCERAIAVGIAALGCAPRDLHAHSASASSGNEKRAAEVFTTNFVRWVRGELMLNERNA